MATVLQLGRRVLECPAIMGDSSEHHMATVLQLGGCPLERDILAARGMPRLGELQATIDTKPSDATFEPKPWDVEIKEKTRAFSDKA